VERGLDGVEHGFQLDEPAVRAMAERGVTLVPTLIVTRAREFYERVGAPAWLIERALGAGEAHVSGVRAAAEAGVPLAVGTDMRPGDPFEETNAHTREVEYLTELIGLEPTQAIRAATLGAAQWLGIADDVGTIDAGKRADLVACDGDPAADISAIRSLRFVMKAGKVVRHDRAMPAYV
jgi:imidazolonepropionase-like amidohydrolase